MTAFESSTINTSNSHISTPPEGYSDSSRALYQVAQILLQQVVDLLNTTITKDCELSHPSTLIPGSTIGKHLRHVNDHFRLLLDSLRSSSSSSTSGGEQLLECNYDIRTRNIASETSHAASLESFRHLLRRLERETGEGRNVRPERKVRLEAVTPVRVLLDSSWARELWFSCLHATHHFALLRVVAVGELGLDIPKEFGVAPSTLVSRIEREEREREREREKL
ncbi:hypothetical protein T439DRAFT_328562 [Meredithblackwellia eburnea MCA 4105]